MRTALFFGCAALMYAAVLPYAAEQEKWRAAYEQELKAADGWLTVAGLAWLHEGDNLVGSAEGSDIVLPARLPAKVGVLRVTGPTVVFERLSPPGRTELKQDSSGHPGVVSVGDTSFTVIKRGGKTGVRLRDPQAETRRTFTGCKWFPPAEAWRVQAKWTAYPKPKTIKITNILGMVSDEPSPGYAEFSVNGKTYRLDPVTEGNELFFLFKDETSGRSTYGAGRFVYAAMPKGDRVEIDFNQAHNPPCAFTAFATCPLPPRQNTLALAVEAGEKNYGNHRP